jgi:plastocyanin
MLSLALLAFPLLAAAAVHDVQVGQDGLAFTPEALSANVGDQVIFHFKAKNHTASQSSFASPCGQLDGGFDSGFMPVPAGSTDFPTFTYTVTGTAPVWVHCKQAADTPASHCGQGMVFAINCPTDPTAKNSFTNFKAAAHAIGAQLAAAASSASAGSPAYPTGGSPAYPTDAPAAPTAPVLVTNTIVVEQSTWTTTYSSYPNSPNPTPASLEGNVHVVTVGGDSTLTYNPSHIVAQPRDIISFQFVSKNHTATQSSFANPCKKLESTTNTPGFDSGFMFIANGSAPSVWNITVNDTAPIWVYCRQKTPVDHCGMGMVFAVNSDETPTSQKTYSIFQSNAKAQEANASAASSNGTNSSPGSSPSPSSPPSSASSTRISTGLALSVVGVVFALVL